MSLAPSEERALARIEDSLRVSDPRLAVMMATFSVLVTRRRISGWTCTSPRRSRLRRLIVVAVALAAIGLIVLIATVRSRSG